MDIVKCWACHKQFPQIVTHVHHKAPRRAGGKDNPGNLVRICPTDHTTVHAVTRLLRKGRTGEANAALRLAARGKDNYEKRLAKLVKVEAQSWEEAEPQDTQAIHAELPIAVYQTLKAAASTMRMGGKTMGVGRLMAGILTRWSEKWASGQLKD